MTGGLTIGEQLAIGPMEPRHAAMIAPQASQALTLGLQFEMDAAYGAELCSAPGEAWAAVAHNWMGERVVAMFGLAETFRHKQALGWAVLAEGIGAHHLAVTRFARDRIVRGHYRRIELIVECADAEPVVARFPDLDPGQLLAVLTSRPALTPGVRWAIALGLTPAHVLRQYGAASETHMLLERIC